MILRQFLHTSPTVAASYLFGCGGKQAGAVVDPIEPPTFYRKTPKKSVCASSLSSTRMSTRTTSPPGGRLNLGVADQLARVAS